MLRSKLLEIYKSANFTYEEAVSEIDFIMEILFDLSPKDCFLGLKVPEELYNNVIKIVNERVSTKQPIQYLTGYAYFYGRKFYVDKSTLIPRPETEILTLEVIKHIKQINNPVILDIGTGTGCIPITILIENKTAKATTADISEGALSVAKKNSDKYELSNRLNIIKSDLFENVKGKFDVIVSNPPYIPLKDKQSLQIEVKNFEPSNALFTNDYYGIEFYEKIISQAENYLKQNGVILFELGVNQAKMVSDILLKNNFSDIEIIKDIEGKERVIKAKII